MSSGYQQASVFSSEQYRALRQGAGALVRPERRMLRVSGADRRSYLQGLLTNDIASLEAGSGCYAAFLTPQGRMIADMRVLETGSVILLDLDAEVAGDVRDRLEQFIFSEDVRIEDLSHECLVVGVYGPYAWETVARTLRVQRDSTAIGPSSPEYHNVVLPDDGKSVRIVRSWEIGVEGFDLFMDAGRGAALLAALRDAGAVVVEAATSEVTRIEAGRPAWGRDMTSDTIPLEAGIEARAISQTKGCYVGQEVIIRVLHRGHGRVARRLVGLVVGPPGVAAAGDRLVADGRDIGSVTSAAFSPSLERSIALGYVHRDFVEPSTRLTIVHGEAAVDARVARLPFVGQETRRS